MVEKQKVLIEKVIEQITIDCGMQDFTAIEELISDISEEKLKGFLSENNSNINSIGGRLSHE
jgi:hypothetical protein